MDTIDYANKLVKEFAVDQSDAIKALDAEAADQRADAFRVRRLTESQALDAAYTNICEWLRTGNDYVINLDWEDVCRFAFSHRKACVWAVLTVKARTAKVAA